MTTLGAQAQQQRAAQLFREDAAARSAAAQSPLAASLRQSRPLTIDAMGMQAALATAPLEGRGAAPLLFAMPMPDGSTGTFRVVESPVMEPALAAQFPGIKTYSGVGVDDPTASIRLDVTPLGFHAQVLSANGTAYIDPVSRTDQQHYLSFYHKDMALSQWNCGVSTPSGSSAAAQRGGTAQRTVGTSYRTFRLAVAADGEYTATKGGTAAGGLSGVVTSVNRVVGVYETELAVRMVLVANNNLIIYTNASTDPYSNTSPSALLSQNQTNLDAVIGAANYDIGHVFTTGGGGLAALGVVCRAGVKAQGETGLPNPVGDAYDIDYVAHEMGHQFGGNHTFNSSTSNCGGGNRNAGTAYEPGSGSTIMAYAGICGTDDLQPHSDPFFHVVSFEEIQTYLGTVTCGTTTTTSNVPPAIAALPASGKVIPASTPFKLTASATDANGDALTYNWEEYDLGPSVALGAVQTAGQTPPLFRSFVPTASGTRYFPRLTDLVNNTTVAGEQLPTVSRNLNFRVTVRDGQRGVNSSSTVALSSTSAAGPFVVTAPNTAVTWAGNSSQTVTWNVAGTTANGINCANVNIRLSTDGGLTYPTVLLANTTNDGSEAITVPNVATTTARIMVEAADNYFFDISNANFTITAATTVTAVSSVRTSASPTTASSVGFTVTFSGAVTGLSASNFAVLTTGAVSGASVASVSGSGNTYTVTVNTGTGNGTVQLQLNNSTGVTPTVSNVPFVGDSYSINRTTPTVTTSPASNITYYSAVVGGEVTDDGGSPVTQRGIVLRGAGFSSSGYIVNIGSGTGPFSTTVTGLRSGSRYDVQAFATNSEGTSYAVSTTFSTLPSTTAVSSMRMNASPTAAATVGYSFSFASPVTGLSTSNFGVVTTGAVSGASVASVSGSGNNYTVIVNTGTGNGTLQLQIVNSNGVTPVVTNLPFGQDIYTISRATATVTTSVSNITTNSAVVGGEVTADGGAAVTERGFVFVLGTGVPTTSNSPTFNLGSGLGVFYTTFGGLSSNTTYTVRAYAINSEGTSYGLPITFTTTAATTAAPVMTAPASNSLLTTTTPTYSGTAPAGSTVTVYVDNVSIGTTTATGGNFSLMQPSALGQGTHSVYATAQLSGQTASGSSNTNSFTVDTVAPTVTLSSTAGNPTSTSPIPVTAVFSESVADFVATDVTVSNGTVSNFSGSGTSYSFDVTPTASGTVTVNVAANVAHDAAGNGNTAAAPLTRTYTPSTTPGTVQVLYQNDEQPNQPLNNAIRPNLQVVNNSTVAIPYSELTVRYWLTVENSSTLTTSVNWAQMGTSLVQSHYVLLATPRQGATGYVEYTFSAGAGTLVPGGNSGVILSSANKPNWTNFDETDDYSFASNSTYLPTTRITAYRNGVLISGIEPPVVSAAPSLKVYAENQNTSATAQLITTVAQVGNVGAVPVNYGDLAVRYWYTPDGPSPVSGSVDYAQLGSSNMTLTTGQQGTQSYAELRFAAGLGTLAPGTTTGDIIFRLHMYNYSSFDQSNDYSYRPAAPLTEHPKMTIYRAGVLIYGTEPAGARAVAARPGSADEVALTTTLESYPNPFGGTVRLDFSLSLAGKYTLAVYDLQGRLVEKLAAGTAPAGERQHVKWQAANYASGFYLVRLTTDAGVHQMKLVKQ
ncbi:hypothetical protein GCM10027345_39970 [Hymenobacter daeguensis]